MALRRPLALTALLSIFAATGTAQSSASYWKFDEPSGATALDAVGTNPGTLANGVTRLKNGRISHALSFDGVDDLVTVPDAPSLRSPAFSVSLWMRRNGSQPDFARLLNKGNVTVAPYGSYELEFDGANDTVVNWHLGFTDTTSAVARTVTPVGNQRWTHLVATYDGDALRLYVNGLLEGTAVTGHKTVQFDAAPLTYGGAGGGSHFRGDLDEVRYFNHALTAAEVQAVYGGAVHTPTITVTSPNTASTWLIGSTQPISWNQTFSTSSTSTIELSRDNGVTWAAIAAAVPNGTAGTYNWLVTGPATSAARIRVTASDGSATDISDVAFAISGAAITVTAPDGPPTMWTANQPATISWTGNVGPQDYVKLELSTDGGRTYPIVIAASTPSDGSESIIVQGAWVTTLARVKVSWVTDPSRFDMSNTTFTIQPAPLTHVTFQPTSDVFPNPERGFFTWTDMSYADYSWVRVQGNTLTRPYFRLDNYRDTPLPQTFLDQLSAEFQKARQAGVKIIPRFAYNFGPYPNPDPDASLSQIQQHLQQLAPILAANVDVISSMEAGFIGAWGEWHSSTHGLDLDGTAKAMVLNALLAALPTSRMVALRYPSDMQLLNGAPINPTEAYTGTNHARVGMHNDCFLASDTDWGTWGRSGNSIVYDKDYVAQNSQFSVVGGETCNPNPPRSDCPTALAELSYMHWTYLNADFEPNVLQGFVNGGCYDEINRRLGYRFALMSGDYSQTVQRGQPFTYSLQLSNGGFASMLNARPVWVVFSKGTEQYGCQVSVDPRTWTPGVTTTFSGSCVLPATMTTGTYSWALWLPDQASSLRTNPLYAVRLANQNVWDAAQGYNVLATSVMVTP